MLRIAKLTDYGIVLMAHFARQDLGLLLSTREVAEGTRFSAPTVSKLLKLLARADLLDLVDRRADQLGQQLRR